MGLFRRIKKEIKDPIDYDALARRTLNPIIDGDMVYIPHLDVWVKKPGPLNIRHARPQQYFEERIEPKEAQSFKDQWFDQPKPEPTQEAGPHLPALDPPVETLATQPTQATQNNPELSNPTQDPPKVTSTIAKQAQTFEKQEAHPAPSDASNREENFYHLPSLNTTILCIFYIFVGNTPVEVGRKKVRSDRQVVRFNKEKYIVNTQKLKMIRPWNYFLKNNMQAYLEFKIHEPQPISVYLSDPLIDADSLDRITNQKNVATMLKNPTQTLEMITLVAIIAAVIGSGLAFWMVANPGAAEDIRYILVPRDERPPPQGVIIDPPTTNPNPPITPGIPTNPNRDIP